MALVDYGDWTPVETGSDVLVRVQAASAIEQAARGENMTSGTKEVPASGGFVMAVGAKGSTLEEDDTAASNVILIARKVRAGVRVAEEDIADSVANIVDVKSAEWATSYAKFLDNAALGVTAAENGTTVPFTSVYAAATTASNVLQTAGALEYDDLNSVLSEYEQGDYFAMDRTVVIASPAYLGELRGIKDAQGNPVFVSGAGDRPDQLFGYNIVWSTGARTSATASQSPDGNPLLVVANADFLIRGDRSNPEFRLDYQELTDEHVLQGRARKAFKLGHAEAAQVLEITAV